VEIEIVTLAVKVQNLQSRPASHMLTYGKTAVSAPAARPVFDPSTGAALATAIIDRADLRPDDRIAGPAVIVERETSTVVTALFDAVMQVDGSLLLVRKDRPGREQAA